MAKLKLCITDEDIAAAERFEILNPVLHKLHHTTGTLWRLCDDGVALEIMSPFRATRLPSWALHNWNLDANDNSANDCVLPCELELELYTLRANGNDSTAENLQKAMKNGALDCEIMQSALLQVLERNGWLNCRMVCSQIFVEGVEPYRTIVLTDDALHRAQDWLRSAFEPNALSQDLEGNLRSLEATLRLPAELHSPLTGEPVQPITLNFPSCLFEATA